MKKSMLFIACAVLSVAVLAQTPQQPAAATGKTVTTKSVKQKKPVSDSAKATHDVARHKAVKSKHAVKDASGKTKKMYKQDAKTEKTVAKEHKPVVKTHKKATGKKKIPATTPDSAGAPPKS